MRRTATSTSFWGFVFDAVAPVKRQLPTSAPHEDACAALSSPTFTPMRQLISRGSYGLLGRMDTALEAPKPGGTSTVAKSNKRKINGEGAQPPARRRRIDGAAQAWSFVTGLEQDGTPAGACYFAWRGLQCTRKNRAYGHAPFSPNRLRTQGPPAPTSMQQPQQYQQQQLQQQKAPPPPPPQQQQQQQQQRTAPPAAVAKFSFSHGQQGRGSGTYGRSGTRGGRGAGNN